MLAYLSLGSNIGNREENITYSINQIKEVLKPLFFYQSKIIETKPYGFENQSDFLNCVVEIETELSPITILKEINEIESNFGRTRNPNLRWGPRTIDIDILTYASYIVKIDSPQLILPHYDFHNRAFLLELFKQLNPDFVHPIINKTISDIYEELVTKAN